MIIDQPSRRTLPARSKAIEAFVVHTAATTDLGAALRYYTSTEGLQPHWCIAPNGDAYHIVDDGKVAYHCAIEDKEAELYSKGFGEWARWTWNNGKPIRQSEPSAVYGAWRQAWPTLESPLGLPTGRRPNSVSIGVELIWPKTKTPDIFTDEQYSMLAGIIANGARRHSLTLERRRVVGHSDCSPMRRPAYSDPGAKFNFPRLLSLASTFYKAVQNG